MSVQVFRAAAKATVAETVKEHAALARREHARIMNTDPVPQSYVRLVDDRTGVSEEKVKPGGRIEYRYQRIGDIVQTAMEMLFDLSPVLSGDYRMGHTIFIGGAAVANLAGWDGTGEVVIANLVPYARKIELGVMTMRVPETDHVYQQAAFMLDQRYGNQVRVRFVYRGFVGGTIAGGKAHGKSDNRYPALEIEAR